MKNLEDLELMPVWVNPGHLAKSAVVLMQGHQMRCIALRDQSSVLGVVTLDAALAAGDMAPCGAIAAKGSHEFSGTESLLQAAQVFVDRDLDYAIVTRQGEFLGLVTANMLLKELRRSWDPLTGLGWSDRLREFGIDRLTHGVEITLLFMDLDQFGQYNKLYGHIVGDRVLRRVATELKSMVDPKRDVLVRYGGDEFALCSIRTRPEAEELAQAIDSRITGLFVGDAYRPISMTIGISGGRRSVMRADTHFGSMFDELLNQASTDCISKKKPASEFA